MKKYFPAAVMCLVICLSLTPIVNSCKSAHASTAAKTKSIAGLWVGTYSADQLPKQGMLFSSFTLYPDGTLLYKSKGGDGKDYYSGGKWELKNNVFTATMISFPNESFAPVTQEITATLLNFDTLADGVWKDVDNPSGYPLKGAFHDMHKVK
ncbi:MAG: hypothetical protein QM791_15300 [Ferruginibacter sp.]